MTDAAGRLARSTVACGHARFPPQLRLGHVDARPFLCGAWCARPDPSERRLEAVRVPGAAVSVTEPAPVQELRHLGHRFAACPLGQFHLREQVRAATLRFRALRLHVSAHWSPSPSSCCWPGGRPPADAPEARAVDVVRTFRSGRPSTRSPSTRSPALPLARSPQHAAQDVLVLTAEHDQDKVFDTAARVGGGRPALRPAHPVQDEAVVAGQRPHGGGSARRSPMLQPCPDVIPLRAVSHAAHRAIHRAFCIGANTFPASPRTTSPSESLRVSGSSLPERTTSTAPSGEVGQAFPQRFGDPIGFNGIARRRLACRPSRGCRRQEGRAAGNVVGGFAGHRNTHGLMRTKWRAARDPRSSRPACIKGGRSARPSAGLCSRVCAGRKTLCLKWTAQRLHRVFPRNVATDPPRSLGRPAGSRSPSCRAGWYRRTPASATVCRELVRPTSDAQDQRAWDAGTATLLSAARAIWAWASTIGRYFAAKARSSGSMPDCACWR